MSIDLDSGLLECDECYQPFVKFDYVITGFEIVEIGRPVRDLHFHRYCVKGRYEY